MMAVLMRNAKANPYWNVPPELVKTLTAKKVKEQGLSYFSDFHYEVLSDWDANAQLIDPKSVNWKSIASSKKLPTILVRQLPGPWNSMGEMKFEMPNDFGIYLHDTPHEGTVRADDRWISNGCVRLQDYRRFAGWVFGQMPQETSQPEQHDPAAETGPDLSDLSDGRGEPQRRNLPPRPLRPGHPGDAADVRRAGEGGVGGLSGRLEPRNSDRRGAMVKLQLSALSP